MMMEVGTEVKVTWGAYKGIEGEVTTISGKNVTVKLALGFEAQMSTDHIEVLKNEDEISSNGVVVKAGSYVESGNALYYVVRIEGKKAACLRVNPCNGRTRKGAKELLFRISNLYCRV